MKKLQKLQMKHKEMDTSGIIILIVYTIGIPIISSFFPEGVLSTTVANTGLICLGIYTVYKVKKEFSPLYEKLEQLNHYSYIVAIVAMIIIVFGILLSFLKTEFNVSDNMNQKTIVQSIASISLIQSITIAVFIPLIEEILFKHYFFKKTKTLESKKILKVVIVSLLFAMLHCFSEIITLDYTIIYDVMYYFVFSIGTYIIYMKTNNLLFPISIHMLCNIVALIL